MQRNRLVIEPRIYDVKHRVIYLRLQGVTYNATRNIAQRILVREEGSSSISKPVGSSNLTCCSLSYWLKIDFVLAKNRKGYTCNNKRANETIKSCASFNFCECFEICKIRKIKRLVINSRYTVVILLLYFIQACRVHY